MNSQFMNENIAMLSGGSQLTRKAGSQFRAPDMRVAHLLLAVRQLELCLTGFEDLPDSDLTELISCAILACGFTEPAETRCAIAPGAGGDRMFRFRIVTGYWT